MPDKGKLLEEYQEASGKVSELIRNLSLGGLAVIWIFKDANDTLKTLDGKLLTAILFLVISLGVDLIHYFSRTVAIYSVYRAVKKSNLNSKDYPTWLSNLSWLFFFGKILSMVIAYAYIYCFIKS